MKPVVFANKAKCPTAVLDAAVVLLDKVAYPNAVLSPAVVLSI